jgi:hypothetical protein
VGRLHSEELFNSAPKVGRFHSEELFNSAAKVGRLHRQLSEKRFVSGTQLGLRK